MLDGGGIATRVRNQQVQHAKLRHVLVEPSQRAFFHHDASIVRDGLERRIEVRRVVGQNAQQYALAQVIHYPVRDRALKLRVHRARGQHLGTFGEVDINALQIAGADAEGREDGFGMRRHATVLHTHGHPFAA